MRKGGGVAGFYIVQMKAKLKHTRIEVNHDALGIDGFGYPARATEVEDSKTVGPRFRVLPYLHAQ